MVARVWLDRFQTFKDYLPVWVERVEFFSMEVVVRVL